MNIAQSDAAENLYIVSRRILPQTEESLWAGPTQKKRAQKKGPLRALFKIKNNYSDPSYPRARAYYQKRGLQVYGHNDRYR